MSDQDGSGLRAISIAISKDLVLLVLGFRDIQEAHL